MDVRRRIDINCDLGEGMPNDADLMPFISSCNIACGGHFGTSETMRTAIQLAKLHGVKIGAHPSYPDKVNFGRKTLEISPSELAKSIRKQVLDFHSICQEEGVTPNHIKLHGALYNESARYEAVANVVQRAYEDLKIDLPIYTPPNSLLAKKMTNTISEVFIDRAYNDDGSLVPRSKENAIIHDPIEAWNQLQHLYFGEEVISVSGKTVQMIAKTFCLHGDTENALEIAQYIGAQLDSSNISLDRNG